MQRSKRTYVGVGMDMTVSTEQQNNLEKALSCDPETTSRDVLRPLERATLEEFSNAMTRLLEKTPPQERQQLADRFLEKIRYIPTTHHVEKYITACAKAFETYPLLFINAVRMIRKGELLNPVIPARAMVIAENILFFYNKNIESTAKEIGLSASEFIQDYICVSNITVEKHADKCMFILMSLGSVISEKQFLFPNVAADIFRKLSLFEMDVNKSGEYKNIINNIFRCVQGFNINSPGKESSLKQISYYLYWLRVFYLRNQDKINYEMNQDVKFHARALCGMLEQCIEVSVNFSKSAINQLRLGVLHLGNHVDIGDKLKTFLNDTTVRDVKQTIQSDLEKDVKKKLDNLIKVLNEKNKDINISIENNVNRSEFELDFCVAIKSDTKKIEINIEVDTVVFHGSPDAIAKNIARDINLRERGIQVIRLVVQSDHGERGNYSEMVDKLTSHIETFKSLQGTESRLLSYLYKPQKTEKEDMGYRPLSYTSK